MYQIRKVFKFEGSHILNSAYSLECSNHVHGHSYIVEVFLKTEKLDEHGMVVDFKFLKQQVQQIFNSWDHAFVVSKYDQRFIKDDNSLVDIFFNGNPTAENMAQYFYDECRKKIALVNKVRVHETATGWAEYYEGN